MIRSIVRLLGVTVFALCVPAPSAFADGSELGLSRDGVHWFDSLSKPIFDEDFRWVPGDSQTTTFYVRNQASSSAELRLQVQGSGDPELLSADDIHLEARAAGGPWIELQNGIDSKRLHESVVGAGTSVPVEVRATFDAASTNQSQMRAVELRLVVTLSQSLNDDGGALPDTGSAELRWTAAIGAILVGVGFALMSRRRRVDQEVAHA